MPRGLLRFRADRRTLAFTAVHFGLVGVALGGRPTGWAAIGLGAAIAYSTFVQLIASHNAMHSPVFRSRRLNRAWQVLLSLTFGYPVTAFVPTHNLSHHRHLQTPRDVLRTTEVRHRLNALNLLHHSVASALHIHLLNAAYARKKSAKPSTWFRQMRVELVAAVLFVAVSLALAPAAALSLLVLPYLIGHLMLFGFGYLQHDGCDADDAWNHSRNFTGALFNFLIFDNGYHAVHHNQPGLHWSRARAEHERTIAPNAHAELQQRSVLAYLWRTFVWPGARIRYDGRPVTLREPRNRDLWMAGRAVPEKE